MNRRTFLQAVVGNLALVALGKRSQTAEAVSAGKTAPFFARRNPDIIVIGAGAFGGWTAFYLQQMGASVTLLDAYGPGNARASSGGETRLIRADYGEDLLYTRLALRAYELWAHWQTEWGKQIMLSTGRLVLIPEGMQHDVYERKKRLAKFGVETEILKQAELRARWPQVDFDGIEIGMFNPGGVGGSALKARDACLAVADAFRQKGGQVEIARAVPGRTGRGRLQHLRLANGKMLSAQHYIFACGPWLIKVLPDLLHPRLTVRRRETFFFGIPAGDTRFVHPNLPEWAFMGSRYWGFPDFDGRGFKVAVYPDLNEFDPDTDERLVNPYEAKRAHEFVAQRFPALKGQPITETRVCQVTNSEEGTHFIIDRHPQMENVWIMGAGNGHGFKHGPAIGEYMANRILGSTPHPELDEAFRLHKS